jgi:hypothetical protein
MTRTITVSLSVTTVEEMTVEINGRTITCAGYTVSYFRQTAVTFLVFGAGYSVSIYPKNMPEADFSYLP